jgi:hypothetical protein
MARAEPSQSLRPASFRDRLFHQQMPALAPYEIFPRVIIMNRLCVCATVVVMLSALSVPATALIFGAAPTGNAEQVSPAGPLAVTQALSPDGKPVRVISLSPTNPPADGVVTSWHSDASRPSGSEFSAPPSAKPEPTEEVSTKPAINTADDTHVVRKPAAAPRRNTRSASASARKFLVVTGLY